jgi:hypothetical protein
MAYFILGYFSTKLGTSVDGHDIFLSEMAYFIFGYFSMKLGKYVDGHEKIIA